MENRIGVAHPHDIPVSGPGTTDAERLISVNFVSKRLFEKANTRFRKKKELI